MDSDCIGLQRNTRIKSSEESREKRGSMCGGLTKLKEERRRDKGFQCNFSSQHESGCGTVLGGLRVLKFKKKKRKKGGLK